MTLFLDAIYLPVRPSGAKEGVLCAWGFTEAGERVLVSACLGCDSQRRTGSALAAISPARGLQAPLLIVADGAPGLINAVEQLWPRPIASAARCIGCATSSPSSPSGSMSANRILRDRVEPLLALPRIRLTAAEIAEMLDMARPSSR